MPIEFGALLFEGVKKVVFTAISKRVVFAGENFLTRRKIESRIDDSVAQVVEQLLPFFENEHLSDQKRQVLVSNCTHELSEILEDPKEVFAASLDGQKVFDRRYEGRRLPQGIRDEGLEDLYAMVFPQIANLICAYPPAIEQWKIAGYREGFRRLDDIAATLGGVANRLDQLTSKNSQTADVLLNRVRQSLTQRVEFQLDLTGLRGDRPDAVPLEKCFIVPELRHSIEVRGGEEGILRIGTTAQVLSSFSGPSIRAVIVGAPGVGKSTWSRWLQRQQLTSERDRLAVLVRLRDLIKDSLPSYQHLIRDAAGTHLREEVDVSVAGRWCELGAVTFILDGFDEVPPEQRDLVLSWIKELHDTTESAGVLLTSRPLTTDHLQKLPKSWQRWDLLPFNEPRITSYISKWYAHAPLLAEKQREVNAAELASKWVNDFALAPLVGTPLMLATIVMVHHMDGELPRGRASLYERYIDGMLGLWDSRWGVPSAVNLSLDLKRRILIHLAVYLHTANIEQLGDQQIQQLIADILPSVGCTHAPEVVLDHLRERTGLLVGPGTWSFVHKNVGEYLVAAAIRDGDCVANGQKLDRLHLFSERHNDRWNNVLFFWAGLTSPGDLQSFVEEVCGKSGNRDFFLALSLIYDQLLPYRLTEPWRSDQILELLKRGFDVRGLPLGRYIAGPHPRKMKIVVQAYLGRLRTPERIGLRTAIWECLKMSTISWKTAADCHFSVLFITWSFFATHTKDEQDLRCALGESQQLKRIPAAWMMFPATWGLRSAARDVRPLSIHKYVEIIRETDAKLDSKIPLFLLGALTYQDYKAATLTNLLSAVESLKHLELDQEWLQLSKKFVRSSIESGKPYDLLTSSLTVLDQAEAMRVDSDLVSRVRDYVLTIKDLRDDRLAPKH